MIQFEWWWLLAILPAPVLLRWLAPPVAAVRRGALRVPTAADFSLAGEGTRRTWRARLPLWLALVAWAALVAAAARPQWLGEPVSVAVSGRDLMLAVDLSGSMDVEDFRLGGEVVDRLTATKAVAGEFIERREGDRVGLILFGRNAYLQAPLTFDRATVNQLLDESAIGLAGQETAIGEAIGLAVKKLQDSGMEEKVLVLISDGANTAGSIAPMRAAELAASAGMRIYTIGIGADRMTIRNLFGTRQVNPSRALDEETLNGIAQTTGGRYFRARNTAELERIYALLDDFEPVVQDPVFYRPTNALFMWPLGLSMLITAGLMLAGHRLRGAG